MFDGPWYQLGRFWSWIQHDGNSNIVLVGITTVYVVFTYRLLRVSTIQAHEQIQPKLILSLFFTDDDQKRGNVRIENVGDYAVVLLNVALDCHWSGKLFERYTYEILEYALIPPKTDIGTDFDFRKALDHIATGMFSYALTVVGSDTSKRVPMTYEYLPLFHITRLKSGKPWRVSLRLCWRPILIGYHRTIGRFLTSVRLLFSGKTGGNV